MVDPATILAHPKNWRTHGPEQRSALVAELDRVGFVQSVVVNRTTGHLVDGHLRVEVAAERGVGTIPVVYVELSPEEEARVLVALDPLGSMAGTNDALLQDLLDGLDLENRALEQHLVTFLAGGRRGATEPDDVPPVPEGPEVWVQPGDVWLLGDHRLMCGDSTKAEDVARLMDGELVQAIVTDPPYGIDHDGITNDDPAGLRTLYDGALSALPVKDAVIVAFHSPRMFPVWLDSLRAAGQTFERMLWLHRITAMGTYPWRGWIMASDAILVSSTGSPDWPKQSSWVHDTYTKDAGKAEPTAVIGSHTTVKPLAIVADVLSRLPSGPCYDPFVGSGTTIIAAETLGRRCYAMELEPRYVQVAIERWQEFTGREAVRG